MRFNLILAFAAGMALASGALFVGVRHYQQAAQSTRAATEPVETRAPAPIRAPLADATPVEPASLPAAVDSRPAPAPPAAKAAEPAVVRSSRTANGREQVRVLPAPSPKPSPMPKIAEAQPPAVAPALTPPSEEERTVPPPVVPENPPAPAPAVAQNEPAPEPQMEPEGPGPHVVTLARGTELRVRVGETLTTDRNRAGDRFLATLEQPLIIDGFVIAERGARVEGEVAASDRGPRGGGVSHLAVRLVKFETADQQHIPIQTGVWNRDGSSPSGRDAATILATTAIGAAIGAMAGGGKGAGIGAAAGGAAGTAGVLAAHGPAAAIPVETRLTFEVARPVRITERLN